MVLFLFSVAALGTYLMLGNWIQNLMGPVLFLLGIYISFISKVTLKISEKEIHLTKFEKTKMLRWDEISEINDYKLWISMIDSHNNIRITINSLLESYSEIRDFIARKRPHFLSA